MFYAWQSRIRIGLSCEVIEAGRARTLGLDLTVQPHLDLQGLINHWSMQAGTVAFSEPPTLAVIQVARFQGSGKLTCAIECQPKISLPVFRDDDTVDTIAVTYQLQASCIHLGAQATSGHYPAILWDEASSQFHVTEDDQAAELLLFR